MAPLTRGRPLTGAAGVTAHGQEGAQERPHPSADELVDGPTGPTDPFGARLHAAHRPPCPALPRQERERGPGRREICPLSFSSPPSPRAALIGRTVAQGCPPCDRAFPRMGREITRPGS
jgi:hypothetical protein